MLTTDDRKAIIAYRCEKAMADLHQAKEVAKLVFWNLAGNRLYYAAFHMASALLLDKGMTARTHSGVIHMIGAQFIAKSLISKEYGRIFSRLFELRHSGDYDDMYNATEEEVAPYIEKTEAFLNEMKGLLTFQD
ncbi:MAG: HEPN domain-containing protein [Bacteroidaceae bacterium]|nr:HEPN domain-containing protein [Bacteroidaceae bacterium]